MKASGRRCRLHAPRRAGLKLTLQPQDYYVGCCPSYSDRHEVHPDAPSPDLAVSCRGRVDIHVLPEEFFCVH